MNPKHSHIAFRCPDCTDVILGVIGESALSLNMRLKCTCGASALDITPTTDKKIKLSVPCILCKENHTYTVSPGILFERDIFTLNCPYANVNIAFIGSSEKIEESVAESTSKLEKLLADMGAEAIEDIQPVDMDEDDIEQIKLEGFEELTNEKIVKLKEFVTILDDVVSFTEEEIYRIQEKYEEYLNNNF